MSEDRDLLVYLEDIVDAASKSKGVINDLPEIIDRINNIIDRISE